MNQEADYCFIVNDAEQAFSDPLNLDPLLPAYSAKGWNLRARLAANDAYLEKGSAISLGERHVFYGFVLESKTFAGTFAVVVRGTDGAVEWYMDGLAAERPYPGGGIVETGFWLIYSSMTLRGLDGSEGPLMAGLQRLIGRGRAIVIGHSLGASIATLLAVDLSRYLLDGRTALRAIASPHPGDAIFAQLVASRIADARSVAYARDLVPMVPPSIPFLMRYTALPNRVVLPASDQICDKLLCNHHAVTYGILQDPAALAEIPADFPYRSCYPSLAAPAGGA
jgi:hypothetical protein